MRKPFSNTNCAKCNKPLDYTDNKSCVFVGSAHYEKQPILCKECYRKWSKYYNKVVLLPTHECRDAKCIKEVWITYFEGWLIGRRKTKPERVIFT